MPPRQMPVERIAGGSHVSTAKETPTARRAAAIGRWLTGGRTGGSRHRDVQGGTTRAAVLGAGDAAVTYGVGSLLGVSTT